MNKINDGAFHVMCEMCGVDNAIKAASNMGMKPTNEQIETERKKEEEFVQEWDKVFKQKEV